MVFGLTSEQVMEIYFQNYQKHTEELQAQLEASVTGESPEMAQWLSHRFNVSPNLPLEYSILIGTILWSIMDTISQNNEAITEAILKHRN